MKPSRHIAVSAVISAILWGLTRSLTASAAALATGILIDLDHVPDYWLHVFMKKERFGVHHFFHICHRSLLKKGFLLLHAVEWVVLAWVLYALMPGNMLVLGCAVGLSQHLFFDQLTNPIHWYGYSILYRACTRFELNAIRKTPRSDEELLDVD